MCLRGGFVNISGYSSIGRWTVKSPCTGWDQDIDIFLMALIKM